MITAITIARVKWMGAREKLKRRPRTVNDIVGLFCRILSHQVWKKIKLILKHLKRNTELYFYEGFTTGFEFRDILYGHLWPLAVGLVCKACSLDFGSRLLWTRTFSISGKTCRYMFVTQVRTGKRHHCQISTKNYK